jgi:hypothetical protein
MGCALERWLRTRKREPNGDAKAPLLSEEWCTKPSFSTPDGDKPAFFVPMVHKTVVFHRKWGYLSPQCSRSHGEGAVHMLSNYSGEFTANTFLIWEEKRQVCVPYIHDVA